MPPLTLGILETGQPPDALRPAFGGYPPMFEALLGDRFRYRAFDVAADRPPSDPTACDAWLITGSPAGVYDESPWIAPLMAFISAAYGRRKLVGVCFGHQVMAHALGGHAEKSARGWGVGRQAYRIEQQAPWMDGALEVSAPASHQDQVTRLPQDAAVLGGNAFTPFGLLEYAGGAGLSMQFHPEFSPDFAKALVQSRRDRLGDLTDGALASLEAPMDRARLAGWIGDFLEG